MSEFDYHFIQQAREYVFLFLLKQKHSSVITTEDQLNQVFPDFKSFMVKFGKQAKELSTSPEDSQ